MPKRFIIDEDNYRYAKTYLIGKAERGEVDFKAATVRMCEYPEELDELVQSRLSKSEVSLLSRAISSQRVRKNKKNSNIKTTRIDLKKGVVLRINSLAKKLNTDQSMLIEALLESTTFKDLKAYLKENH